MTQSKKGDKIMVGSSLRVFTVRVKTFSKKFSETGSGEGLVNKTGRQVFGSDRRMMG